ncbi:MAG: MarR family winged helix-turn-helix transcriptional regulator [Acidimicrobiales bacterium]|jgi:DNA-binding MarR family transcriptional regulator
MPPTRDDVQSMVVALFALTAGIERARRKSKGASALSLLQIVAGHEIGIRPSDIADLQEVHPSLITRQVRELEEAGFVNVAADLADARSCRVTLSAAGANELRRLRQVGLDRFALFVADWEPQEVRTLTALLEKLERSKAATSASGQRATGRRWARQSA